MADIKVELLDHMGDDLDVVNAARVSFDKESEWEFPQLPGEDWELYDKDASLIHYLAAHNHWSPFSHCFLKFRVKAPIFVARQLAKHQVGLSWNEVSRRYVDSEPEFYVPKEWRGRADNVKQGSSSERVFTIEYPCEGAVTPEDDYDELMNMIRAIYKAFLSSGVCPEQARMVLPQSMMTEWIWSGSLYAFARVAKQRIDSHAQRECQEAVEPIAQHCSELFPVSWAALM